jgi:outer membrane protein assembly factor BamB
LRRVSGNGSGIVAFDKLTGEVRYRAADELAAYSSPAFATIDERRWGFLFARGGLVGFQPATGKVDFHFPFRARKLESVNASNPVVVNDTVFITESYGPGSALLRVRPGGYEVIRRDTSPREQSMSAHFMTPIHHEGYLYGSSGQGSGDAALRAVDLATGKIMWSEPGLGRATLLYADRHLVVLTERGQVLLIEATPKQYKVVARATPVFPAADMAGVTAPQRSTGEARTDEKTSDAEPATRALQLLRYPAWSPPVLSHGILYLRGNGRLAAFELISPASH